MHLTASTFNVKAATTLILEHQKKPLVILEKTPKESPQCLLKPTNGPESMQRKPDSQGCRLNLPRTLCASASAPPTP